MSRLSVVQNVVSESDREVVLVMYILHLFPPVVQNMMNNSDQKVALQSYVAFVSICCAECGKQLLTRQRYSLVTFVSICCAEYGE